MINLVHPIVGKEEKKAVCDVIDSRMLASGSSVHEFEQQCAHKWGARFGVAVSSGTTALHAALLACGVVRGDKVITTPLSFIATANSILFCDAQPIFADIEPDTYLLDLNGVEDALKKDKKIKAIIPVHLYGLACDMDAYRYLAKKYKVKIIEDCAQSQGATFKGKIAGSFGDANAFSFYATKNMTTGEGGVVLTNDSRTDSMLRQLINHGRKTQSTHDVLGYNFRLTNIAAAIGIVQLKHLDEWNKKRQQNATYLTRELNKLPFVTTPVVPKNREHVFHQYTIRVPASVRPQLMAHLAKNHIGCGVYYGDVIYRQPLYKKLKYSFKRCPHAERAAAEVLSLPVHPALTRKDLETITSVFNQFKPK